MVRPVLPALLLLASASPVLAQSAAPTDASTTMTDAPAPARVAPGSPTEPAAGPAVAPAAAPASPGDSQPAPASPSDSQPGFKLEGKPGSGVTADFGDSFSLNLKARLQVRYQLDAAAPDATGARELTQTVSLGTARLYFGGHAFTRDFTYLVQLALAPRDYRDGATSPVYDAYIDYKWKRDLSFKLGQYFVPFDRLRTIREFALQMADRPRVVSELTLDRDVGLTLYSDHFLGKDSIVAYRLGAFGGGGMNLATGKQPGVLAVGRLELRPLGAIDDDQEGDLTHHERPGLALGVAGAANWNTNRQRSTTGATFAAGVTDYYQFAADLVFKWHGFAFEAEYVMRGASSDVIVSTDPTVPNDYTQSGQGWILQASYDLPINLEFVGRLSELYARPGTDPAFASLIAATGQELGGGINYYLNGHKLKVQADYIARMPSGFVFDQAQQVAHLQVDATF